MLTKATAKFYFQRGVRGDLHQAPKPSPLFSSLGKEPTSAPCLLRSESRTGSAEITPYYERLSDVPHPLRGVLSGYPQESFDHLVSLSAAVFKVWLSTCRTLLLVRLSYVCLASSSEALTSYVIILNNYSSLASFCRPDYLSTQALSTFRNAPEQTFAF